MSDLLKKDAGALVKAIKSGKTSAVEAVQACLDQVARRNGALNAVVTVDADGAMQSARDADAALARGDAVGPLHGLPMTIKDSWETAGLRTTAGAKEYENHIPTSDAVPVARLKAAGAIVFGKTNLPAYAADIQSYNDVFGLTNNPWDVGRTAGGSSGGAAAALASFMTPLELGSDLAGSIRVPAAMCGVYGHKPSFRAIPMRGHIPGPPGMLSGADLAVAGPLARSAKDLKLAMDVLTGPDEREGRGWTLKFPKPRHKSIKDYRVACWFDDLYAPVQSALGDQLAALGDALERAGAKVDRAARPSFTLAENHAVYLHLLGAVVGAGLPDPVFTQMRRGLPLLKIMNKVGKVPGELVEYVTGCTQRTRDWMAINEARTRLRAAWDVFFKDYDIVLAPVLPTNAFLHNTKGNVVNRKLDIDGKSHDYLELFIWPGLAGTSYLPVSTAPIGVAADGLPASVQIIGPYLEDNSCLDFADKLSSVFGGFTAPPQ